MKSIFKFLSLSVLLSMLLNCGGIKVVDAWKSPEASKHNYKNVLVMARSSNKSAKIAFEREIADKLIARGINATPSFSKFGSTTPTEEMTEERKKMIREILNNEGFDAIVLTSVKDVRERTTSSNNNYYFNDPWNTFYPPYYGSFYGYYYQPYVYGVTIGNTTPTTYTTKTYYLETVAYSLGANDNDQLIAVVTTTIENPKDAYKTADKYTKEIMKALDKK
jgi:hypothetical protein